MNDVRDMQTKHTHTGREKRTTDGRLHLCDTCDDATTTLLCYCYGPNSRPQSSSSSSSSSSSAVLSKNDPLYFITQTAHQQQQKQQQLRTPQKQNKTRKWSAILSSSCWPPMTFILHYYSTYNLEKRKRF